MTGTLNYPRNAGWRQGDRNNAKEFEAEVGTWLGNYKIENLNATDRMDYWVPGLYVEVKEKRQPLSGRWPLPAGCAAEDAFILDELSYRRALEKFPHAWFVLRDVPLERTFIASISELACADRVRVNRVGGTGVAKGKHVYNLLQFRQLTDPGEFLGIAFASAVTMPWKQSACLIETSL